MLLLLVLQLSDDGTSDDDSPTDPVLLAEKDDDEFSLDLSDDSAFLKNELICKGIHLPGADGRWTTGTLIETGEE